MADVTLTHAAGLVAGTRAGRYVLGKSTATGGLPLFLDEAELRWLIHTAGPALLAATPAAALAAVTDPAVTVTITPPAPAPDVEDAPAGVYSEFHAGAASREPALF